MLVLGNLGRVGIGEHHKDLVVPHYLCNGFLQVNPFHDLCPLGNHHGPWTKGYIIRARNVATEFHMVILREEGPIGWSDNF